MSNEQIKARLVAIVERTNILLPSSNATSIEKILTKLEHDCDVKEQARASHRQQCEIADAEKAAEREAQKAFAIGDSVVWDEFGKGRTGIVAGFAEKAITGAHLVVTPTDNKFQRFPSEPRVLKDKVQLAKPEATR